MIDETYIEKFKKDLETKNGLSMLNSYIKPISSFPKNYSCTSIDIGGTNFRIAKVTFDDFGVPKILNERKCILPGSKNEKEITSDEFFSFLANEIRNYDDSNVGLCFSYPCEIQNNKDGKIICMSKDVKISDAEGKLIGEETNKFLKKIGSFERNFSVINDTVSCLLGVEGSNTSLILGTGLNIAFIENDGYIINTESGRYEGFPKESFDLGTPLEMRISGAYLPELLSKCDEEYIYDRGANMIAIELAGIYRHMKRPLKLAVEGSIFHNIKEIQNRIRYYLDKYKVEYEILDGRSRILIGTAISTL